MSALEGVCFLRQPVLPLRDVGTPAPDAFVSQNVSEVLSRQPTIVTGGAVSTSSVRADCPGDTVSTAVSVGSTCGAAPDSCRGFDGRTTSAAVAGCAAGAVTVAGSAAGGVAVDGADARVFEPSVDACTTTGGADCTGSATSSAFA